MNIGLQSCSLIFNTSSSLLILGKLRLLYESNPMGMIIEQAGGAASTGYERILDVVPKEIHMRVPTFLGSIENVFELDQFHKYYDDTEDDE